MEAGGVGMGRTILCPHCNSSLNEDILKEKNSEDICLVCGEALDSNRNNSELNQDGWITWYYYGLKDKKGNKTNMGSLMNKPMDLERFGDTHYLIKEFIAPPKDANGNCEAAKRELRKYVPDAFAPPKENPIRCPRCGSTEYTLMNRGFSIFTGFFGSGNVKRVCNRCQREF